METQSLIERYQKALSNKSRIEDEIENARTLPFYDRFGGEAKRQSDLKILRAELRASIDTVMMVSDSLVQALNADKAEYNTQLREITLKTA